MNKVLVTGATGFVGYNLVKYLSANGYDVLAVVRNGKSIDIQGADVIYIDNLSDISNECMKDRVIVHCAWENVHSTLDTSHYHHVQKQLDFLENVSKSEAYKIIVTGTLYEYGLSHGPVSHLDPVHPNTPYAQAKELVKNAAIKILDGRVDLCWARLFYMYGEGQHERSIYKLLMNAINNGDDVFNMSLGEQLYDYMEINHVSKCLTQLISGNSPQIINVCSGTPISLRRLVENIIYDSESSLKLNLGFYGYREQDSLAIWGKDSFESQMSQNAASTSSSSKHYRSIHSSTFPEIGL
jgi:dTDP-6-deoxy-L-talose 4-dehydrogenase (NAD+)